jgi:DNA-binding IclR family transcriptional regulator
VIKSQYVRYGVQRRPVSSMAPVDSFFVTRTLQAIEVLAFQPASAPQVAEALRVDARTARRLLNRLADDGWVVRIEGRVRTYTLSLRVAALASQFLARAPLTRAAIGTVKALHERTGGIAHVAVPSYRSVLCLAHRAGDSRSRPHTGELIAAHATATGKVLLAHRAPWRESILERPLERMTERTVVDPDAVRSECESTLAQGFAFEDGEYGAGLQTIAAPVAPASGAVMAAVGLAGPPELDVPSRLDAVVEAARRLAREIEETGVAYAA